MACLSRRENVLPRVGKQARLASAARTDTQGHTYSVQRRCYDSSNVCEYYSIPKYHMLWLVDSSAYLFLANPATREREIGCRTKTAMPASCAHERDIVAMRMERSPTIVATIELLVFLGAGNGV